jgi:hypothetical protein
MTGAGAFQTVTTTNQEGKETAYLWVLSRQTKGQFKDCWMTDAVIAAEQPTRDEFAVRGLSISPEEHSGLPAELSHSV